MRFLVDRCAGTGLARGLQADGHDVEDASDWPTDPGDQAILARAVTEDRILVTLDQDFGGLVFALAAPHRGVVRLPDCPPARRLAIMRDLIARHGAELVGGAIVTVRAGRIRISRSTRQG